MMIPNEGKRLLGHLRKSTYAEDELYKGLSTLTRLFSRMAVTAPSAASEGENVVLETVCHLLGMAGEGVLPAATRMKILSFARTLVRRGALDESLTADQATTLAHALFPPREFQSMSAVDDLVLVALGEVAAEAMATGALASACGALRGDLLCQAIDLIVQVHDDSREVATQVASSMIAAMWGAAVDGEGVERVAESRYRNGAQQHEGMSNVHRHIVVHKNGDSTGENESSKDSKLRDEDVLVAGRVLRHLAKRASAELEATGGTLALRLVADAIESGYESSLWVEGGDTEAALRDDVCRLLVQAPLESPDVATLVTHICVLVVSKEMPGLHAQVAQLLLRVHIEICHEEDGLTSSSGEAAVESLAGLFSNPRLLANLHANYDCRPHSPDVFYLLTRIFWRSLQPYHGRLSASNRMAAESLFALLHELADEPNVHDVEVKEGTPSSAIAKELQEMLAAKYSLLQAADVFNTKPKKGIAKLHELGFRTDPDTVALFLRCCPTLDKTVVGDFLGDGADFNSTVLTSFVSLFDFASLQFDAAMRTFLEAFWLPGEAQKISRIMEAFAAGFCASHPIGDPFVDADAAFLIGFALIMLNTDHHSGQIKNKMTLDEFIRNQRDSNGGTGLPRPYLEDMYKSITSQPLSLPMPNQSSDTGRAKDGRNRGGSLSAAVPARQRMSTSAFADLALSGNVRARFDELRSSADYSRSKQVSPSMSSGVKSKHAIYRSYRVAELGTNVFGQLWAQSVASLSTLYDCCSEYDVMFQRRILDAAKHCSSIVSRFQHVNLFDKLLAFLVRATGLCQRPESCGDGSEVVIHGAVLKTSKSRLAAETLFEIVHIHRDLMREGWRDMLEGVRRLYQMSLLPARIAFIEDVQVGAVAPPLPLAAMREARASLEQMRNGGQPLSAMPSSSSFFATSLSFIGMGSSATAKVETVDLYDDWGYLVAASQAVDCDVAPPATTERHLGVAGIVDGAEASSRGLAATGPRVDDDDLRQSISRGGLSLLFESSDRLSEGSLTYLGKALAVGIFHLTGPEPHGADSIARADISANAADSCALHLELLSRLYRENISSRPALLGPTVGEVFERLLPRAAAAIAPDPSAVPNWRYVMHRTVIAATCIALGAPGDEKCAAEVAEQDATRILEHLAALPEQLVRMVAKHIFDATDTFVSDRVGVAPQSVIEGAELKIEREGSVRQSTYIDVGGSRIVSIEVWTAFLSLQASLVAGDSVHRPCGQRLATRFLDVVTRAVGWGAHGAMGGRRLTGPILAPVAKTMAWLSQLDSDSGIDEEDAARAVELLGQSCELLCRGGLMPGDDEENTGVRVWQQALVDLSVSMTDKRVTVREAAATSLLNVTYARSPGWVIAAEWAAALKAMLPHLGDLPRWSIESHRQHDSTTDRHLQRGLEVLVKAFLCKVDKLLLTSDFGSLWLQLLQVVGEFVSADRDDAHEVTLAAGEAVRNMVMVLGTSKVFEGAGQPLWVKTLAHIDSFSPSIRASVEADNATHIPPRIS